MNAPAPIRRREYAAEDGKRDRNQKRAAAIDRRKRKSDRNMRKKSRRKLRGMKSEADADAQIVEAKGATEKQIF